jgi:hypothetical protein
VTPCRPAGHPWPAFAFQKEARSWPNATTTRFWGRPKARRRRDQEGLPQEGEGTSPRPQFRQPGCRSPVQGSERGLRRPEGRRQEGGLRPLRPRGLRWRHGRRRRARAVDPGQGDFASAFSDVFDDLFGDFMGGSSAAAARAGPAAAPTCATTSRDARRGLFGSAEAINVPTSVACGSCSGTGAEGGAEPTTCPTCSGMGKVRAQQGFFTVERTCPTCSASARSSRTPANLRRRRPGREGPRAERQHPRGRRNRHPHPAGRRGRGRAARRSFGRSLHLHRSGGAPDLPTRRHQPALPRAGVDDAAALGGDIEVPTIDGGRQPGENPGRLPIGRQMRLRGKGMPALRGTGMGDMYIELAVETPVNLTPSRKSCCASSRKAAPSRTTPTPAGSSTRCASSGTIWQADRRAADPSGPPDLAGRHHRHVQDVVRGRARRRDLNRPVQTRQDRPDHRRARHLLHQLHD